MQQCTRASAETISGRCSQRPENRGWERPYGFGEVFLVSSFFSTVPSDFSVTVFSFDLTVPSLLTLVLSVLEMVRSHPTNKHEKARIDVTAHIAILRFMPTILACCPTLAIGGYPVPRDRKAPAHSPLAFTNLLLRTLLRDSGIYLAFARSKNTMCDGLPTGV